MVMCTNASTFLFNIEDWQFFQAPHLAADVIFLFPGVVWFQPAGFSRC